MALESVGVRRARSGRRCSRSTRKSIRSWRTSCIACSAVNFPTGGTRICPVPGRRQRNRYAREFRQGAERSGAEHSVADRWFGRSGYFEQDHLKFEGAGDFQPGEYAGRNLHFGVREHVMGASVNGLTVSGIRAFGATFFNFSDYMRASIRLAALMEIPSIFVFTHDSIGVGEDGPTHQPIEQLASLRAMPNLIVFVPATRTKWSKRGRSLRS